MVFAVTMWQTGLSTFVLADSNYFSQPVCLPVEAGKHLQTERPLTESLFCLTCICVCLLACKVATMSLTTVKHKNQHKIERD